MVEGKKYSICGLMIRLILLILAIIFGIVYVYSLKINQDFDVTYYTMHSPKIRNGFRIVHISDLHNREFGKENEYLVKTIEDVKPDIIAITGDLFLKNDPNLDTGVSLCKKLTDIAPTYFCMGNHEGTMQFVNEIPITEALEGQGVFVLWNKIKKVNIAGNDIVMGMCSNKDSFPKHSKDFIEEFVKQKEFQIILTHYPDLFYESNHCLYDKTIDLALAGDYHGGQIRIPYLGGLYAVGYGFFPSYDGGIYDREEKGTLIVSRGLGDAYLHIPAIDKYLPIPRINNQPELVVIDVENK